LGPGVPRGEGRAALTKDHAGAMKTLGRYEILSELGRGAMGVVYKARDPMLERLVAIKTVNMALEEDGAAFYEARFQQEGRAAGGLNHPNIVTIHDIGKKGDIAYMAMEFLDGVELRSMLAPGKPLEPAHAVSIAGQVAEGLAYAHQRGVVHRDIKPPNIMVDANGGIKITDFGIARMRNSQVQTQTGMAMGSPKYMSPEQVLGQRADHRSDIFSLGIILYEMLAGAAPFGGETLAALMYQTLNIAPPAPSALNPAVPEVLDAIVAKTLAKAVEERYQSAAELARDLRACEREIGGTAAMPPPRAATAQTFSAGTHPAKVEADARGAILAQPAVHTREADATPARAEAAPAADAPTRGVARSFDSAEGTQRLAAFTAGAPIAAKAQLSTATQMMRTVRVSAWRGWGRRDWLALAGAALAGLLTAALILA
jgi:serine/threonine-protein kinase